MSKFNRTNEKVDWAKWSWNPVTGCLHGCPYCYARDIAERYHGGFEPKFHPERLDAPKNTKIPKGRAKESGIRNVFVSSMGDLFGDWVSNFQILEVLEAARRAPEWTFIYLTKNPKRLLEFDWPANSWVGATVDCQERVTPTVNVFYALRESKNRPVLFISCEPLNEYVTFCTGPFNALTCADWLIIGGRSKSSWLPAFQPKWEWVQTLLRQAHGARIPVYWKPNLTVRPQGYPK